MPPETLPPYQPRPEVPPCTCYVAHLDAELRFQVRWGAHNPTCPVYRPSRDPVDQRANEKFRARMESPTDQQPPRGGSARDVSESYVCDCTKGFPTYDDLLMHLQTDCPANAPRADVQPRGRQGGVFYEPGATTFATLAQRLRVRPDTTCGACGGVAPLESLRVHRKGQVRFYFECESCGASMMDRNGLAVVE